MATKALSDHASSPIINNVYLLDGRRRHPALAPGHSPPSLRAYVRKEPHETPRATGARGGVRPRRRLPAARVEAPRASVDRLLATPGARVEVPHTQTTSTMAYNWNKTARGIKSTLQTERGMFQGDIAAYESVSKQPANFPQCVPILLLMEMGLRAAAIEDLEAELDSAEVREFKFERCELWLESLPNDSSEYEAFQ
ncbi:hypothetical protein EJ07DRAFT_151495 [Lizonia empirigonia]|nr:hypothetical protein EJ07DRAFT_151495 [Lizonia empirigonia]